MVKNEQKKKEQEARCWNCGRLLFCFAGKEEKEKGIVVSAKCSRCGKKNIIFL